MSQPFVAEIIIAGFNFAPKGFAFCNGQLMSIAQNTALFSLLGTTYAALLPHIYMRISLDKNLSIKNAYHVIQRLKRQKGEEERAKFMMNVLCLYLCLPHFPHI